MKNASNLLYTECFCLINDVMMIGSRFGTVLICPSCTGTTDSDIKIMLNEITPENETEICVSQRGLK